MQLTFFFSVNKWSVFNQLSFFFLKLSLWISLYIQLEYFIHPRKQDNVAMAGRAGDWTCPKQGYMTLHFTVLLLLFDCSGQALLRPLVFMGFFYFLLICPPLFFPTNICVCLNRCQHNNFASRSECQRCNTAKPLAPGEAADWICPNME